MNPDANDRRDQAKEIQERRQVIKQIFDRLPLSVRQGEATLVRGSAGTYFLRGPKGENLATFQDLALGQFVLDAREYLDAFSAYIHQLEGEAYDRRQARRRLDKVADHLYVARDQGLHTKDGQRQVRYAIDALSDRDDDHWNDRR